MDSGRTQENWLYVACYMVRQERRPNLESGNRSSNSTRTEQTMPEQCAFDVAWVGRCRQPAMPEGKMCTEHSNKTCCSCGEPATHECAETGQFVCGFFLCDNCEHTIFPDGTNGGIGFMTTPGFADLKLKSHCKKTEQQVLPWYEREK